MNKLTQKPIIVHTGGKPGAYSAALIDHPELLAAITVQTGHSQESRNWHWQLPMEHITKDTDRFINLEPWYEGIRDDFWTADQLFAYWVNILAGACSHAYGAHGIWNVGDGQFLAHWGKQTYTQAKALKTPGLLGLSHQFWRDTQGYSPSATTTVDQQEGHLIAIHRDDTKGTLSYFPHSEAMEQTLGTHESSGIRIYNPNKGECCDEVPQNGPAVIWNPH